MSDNALIRALRSFGQGASNAVASNVSAPVDGLAWLLRKGGLPIPQNPIGGSDWMAQQGLTAVPQNKLAGLLGETAGMVGPALVQAAAPQIAGGLLALDDHAMEMGRRGVENYMDSTGMRLNMFAGESATGADKAALAKAQELLASGKKPAAVLKETGWFKGGDGKWRFEIDDSAASLRPPNRQAVDWMQGHGSAEYPVGGVANVLDHEKLFAAYPDLADIPARLKTGDSGSYFPNNGFGEAFTLPANFVGGQYKSPQTTLEKTLHELQHAVQKREGFAPGMPSGSLGYSQAPGEIEARLVEARRQLSAAQRAARLPDTRIGVPIK